MRFLAVTIALLVFAGALGARAQSPLDRLTAEQIMARSITQLAPGLYTFGSFAERGIIVVTPEGVIVTDPTNEEHAKQMRAAIAQITDQPVKYVIYSHNHWDHVLGGQIFKDEGATFIAHEKCMPFFNKRPHPQLVMPDETVQGGEAITLGGRNLRLLYFGENHGPCQLVMQLDGTDVLFVSDLVTPYSVGLGFIPDYDIGEYIRSLKEIEAMPGWARMVGNHGLPQAPKAALNQRRRYFEALVEAVAAAQAKGLRGEPLFQSIELAEEFRNMRGYSRHIRQQAERVELYLGMGW